MVMIRAVTPVLGPACEKPLCESVSLSSENKAQVSCRGSGRTMRPQCSKTCCVGLGEYGERLRVEAAA
jgi:hypothetical protein